LANVARDILVDLTLDRGVAGEVQGDVGRPPAGHDLLPVATGSGKIEISEGEHGDCSVLGETAGYHGTVPAGSAAACSANAPGLNLDFARFRAEKSRYRLLRHAHSGLCFAQTGGACFVRRG
jgi:hypothetical protein